MFRLETKGMALEPQRNAMKLVDHFPRRPDPDHRITVLNLSQDIETIRRFAISEAPKMFGNDTCTHSFMTTASRSMPAHTRSIIHGQMPGSLYSRETAQGQLRLENAVTRVPQIPFSVPGACV